MKQLGFVTIISLLIFVLMIPLAFLTGVTGFIPDLILFFALTLFYYWTYDTLRMTLPIFTLLIIGHILHACGIFGWYHISPVPIQWDHITHFFGTFPFALLFFRFAEQWKTKKWFTRKNLLLLIAVFIAATGIGAVVEMSEFIGYLTLGFGDGGLQFGPGDGLPDQNIIDSIGGGWINTGWDFIYNTLGILFGMIIMIIILINKQQEVSSIL
ncbi:hypothetical protein COV18_00205 [Candidatus Woesearchaeota archaeon CG10_big_fil_rev_8_21_14_0_10_37_12]|nr:MAG: hypothetical protein COV18_00205 [Candidatus Woesearchaeota archaeon CG10_big_fil_rev_8_21_14_0_10_37_12]